MGITPIMENQMEKNMVNEMATGVTRFIRDILGTYWGTIGVMEKKMQKNMKT